jgi:hypothetical protein
MSRCENHIEPGSRLGMSGGVKKTEQRVDVVGDDGSSGLELAGRPGLDDIAKWMTIDDCWLTDEDGVRPLTG